MELKTLKDLDFSDCTDTDYAGYDETPYERMNEQEIKNLLKAEAVKWYHRSDGNKHKFIMDFFNLTEEDLKEETMTTEFNLSAEVFNSGDEGGDIIMARDIKEFIRLLKEKAKTGEWNDYTGIDYEQFSKDVDKLAGDKLI